MPLGASRLAFLSKTAEAAAAGRTAFTLTAVGNAQIDTAQSQFGGSSLVLDGTGDWLTVDNSSNEFQFGSGDFTVEGWINPSAINTSGSPIEPIFSKYNTSNSQRMLSFGIYDGFLGYFWASSGGSGNVVQTTQAISTGAWKHIALCREGNTWNTYYDGTRVDTRTLAVTLHASTDPVYIGSYFGASLNEINGYIDELRVSDSARYTGSSYTVPTEPFVNDSNTLLLLHMDGTDGSTEIVDDTGTTPFVVGSVSYSGTTDNYSNQSVNTSGAATGLKTPSAVTIVFLAKPTFNLERLNIMGISDNNNALRNNVFINTSGTIRWYNALSSGTSDKTSTETLTNNDWNLVAISKDVDTGQISGWMNGSSITFPSETNTGKTFDFDGSATDIGIGTARSGDHGNYMWNGDVAWVGVWPTYTDFTNSTNQDAVWDSTNSRAIFPGTDGTRYAFGNPIIYHYGNENTVATNQGNITSYTLTEGGTPTDGDHYVATLGDEPPYSGLSRPLTVTSGSNFLRNTSTKQFGASSADNLPRSSNGYQYIAFDDTKFNPADTSQDWTWEYWIYPTAANRHSGGWGNDAQADLGGMSIYPYGSNNLIIYSGGAGGGWRWNNGGTANSITFNAWNHVAICQDSGVWNVYTNGTRRTSGTPSGTMNPAGWVMVGSLQNGTGFEDGEGYYDEVRVSNIVRYSGTSYTVPTAEFTNDDNTICLLHQNATPFADDAS